MRTLLIILAALGLLLLVVVQAVKMYPYRLYAKWMKGEGQSRFYQVQPFKEMYLSPMELEPIPAYKEDYGQLWKPFPLRNSLVPLPTRHPLFQTVPIIEFKDKTTPPQIGMSILASTGRELSKIFILPTNLYPDYTQGQELFKLPFFKNRILKKDLDSVWKDIFSLKLEVKKKPIDDMIYDLYILHLRSKLLPQEALRYGLIKDGKLAVVELESRNKDYMVELVMSQDSGSIYSYVLVTEKQNEDSRLLRSKFLDNINPTPVDEAMGRLLYTEFKQLHFARQIDQEGMVYLFSSWSQNPESPELLKEMIFYLERGKRFQQQLKVLYRYAFAKYGKTFTGSKTFGEDESPEMQLQRRIDLENVQKLREAERNKGKAPVKIELTPDEKMNLYLKKAKEEGPKESEDMTVH